MLLWVGFETFFLFCSRAERANHAIRSRFMESIDLDLLYLTLVLAGLNQFNRFMYIHFRVSSRKTDDRFQVVKKSSILSTAASIHY